jgi:hypothetical protein
MKSTARREEIRRRRTNDATDEHGAGTSVSARATECPQSGYGPIIAEVGPFRVAGSTPAAVRRVLVAPGMGAAGIVFAHEAAGGTAVILFLVVILVLLWLLGMVTTTTLGGWLHILLVIAVIFLLIRVIRGQPI